MGRTGVTALVALVLTSAAPRAAARGPALEGLCGEAPPAAGFTADGAFRVLLTRMAGPAESVRTAQDQWLPGEQGRVRQIGMAASTELRGAAEGLPGHRDLDWVRTTCFVQGPHAAANLGRRLGADVVIWGVSACTAGDGLDLSCARGGRPGEIRAGLTVLAELPQARPPEAGWRPAPLPHPVNWGLPLRDLDRGDAVLQLVQGLERLVQGAPQGAAHLFERAGVPAASLRTEALLLAGDISGARQAAEVELAQARSVGGERLARALVSQAGVHWFQGHQPLARRDLQAAIAAAGPAGARGVSAYATLQLALLDEQVGDLAGAEAAYASLVDHAFADHDRELRAEVHAGLGRTRQAQGNPEAAHAAWARALPYWDDGAEPWALATVLDGLAATGGRFQRAERAAWLARSRGLWRDLDQTGRALTASAALVRLAAESDVAVREPRASWEARLREAQAVGQGVAVALEATGDREQLAALHRDLARIAMHLGDVATARAWLDAAQAGPQEQAAIARGLAEVLRQQHDAPGALDLYLEALAHAQQADLLREQALTAARIADLCRKVLRDLDQAEQWSRRSLVLHQQALDAGQPPADAAGWAGVGDVALYVAQPAVALAAYGAAEAADLATGDRPDPQLPCKAGRALYALGRFDEAVLAYERGVQVAAARGSTGLVKSCGEGAERAREAARQTE